MAEEQKDAVKTEQAAGAEQPAAEAISKKNKKINRLSQDVLNKKIEEMEKSNNIQCRYYKDLIQRKNELQAGAGK